MTYRLFETLGDTNDESLVFVEDFVEGINMQSWRIYKGERLGGVTPADARIPVRKENRGARLTSFIGNTLSMLLVAGDIQALFQRVCQGVEIEYLPVTILDHRRRPHGKGYCIVNPIGTFDCLDLGKSRIQWSKKKPGTIVRIDEYVLSREKMEGGPELFRVREDPAEYVFGPRLVEALQKHQPEPTNVLWTKLRWGDEV